MLEALAPAAGMRQVNTTAIPATSPARIRRETLMRGVGIRKTLYSAMAAGEHTGVYPQEPNPTAGVAAAARLALCEALLTGKPLRLQIRGSDLAASCALDRF